MALQILKRNFLMCLVDKKRILFIYGSGGHSAQMHRFAPTLMKILPDYEAISLSDSFQEPEWSKKHYITSEFRLKHKHISLLTNIGPIKIFFIAWRIMRRDNIKSMVTTGPGIAIPLAIVGRLLGIKIIHIETWSRFYTGSISGKIMYRIADAFYVQNKSLLKIYPNAIYSGRL